MYLGRPLTTTPPTNELTGPTELGGTPQKNRSYRRQLNSRTGIIWCAQAWHETLKYPKKKQNIHACLHPTINTNT